MVLPTRWMKPYMTSFFPDVNVWLALSDAGHFHHRDASSWFNLLPGDARLIFSGYSQLGLLRLLTNQSLMSQQTLTLGNAWRVYDTWLEDPRVEFHPESRGLDAAFRHATAPFAGKPACKWVSDCYLLACARQSGAILVTFNKALVDLARKQGCQVLIPA